MGSPNNAKPFSLSSERSEPVRVMHAETDCGRNRDDRALAFTQTRCADAATRCHDSVAWISASAIAEQAQRTTEVVCTKVPPSFPSSQNSLCLGPINHGLNAAFYWSSACGGCAHTRQWFNCPWTSPMRLQTGSAFDRSNWRTFLGTMLSARSTHVHIPSKTSLSYPT